MHQITLTADHSTAPQDLTDDQVVQRVREGQVELFEILMRRYNRRLFRVAQAILRNASEAEDVIQEAYVRAYEKLHQFEGRAAFSTWLTKIAVHEALNRRRRQGRLPGSETMDDQEQGWVDSNSVQTPEHAAFLSELREGLENAILAMPENYRTVFMMREVEELSTAETACVLEVTEGAVKTRLHRANHWLRKELTREMRIPATQAFPFDGRRCDRVVEEVLRRIAAFRS